VKDRKMMCAGLLTTVSLGGLLGGARADARLIMKKHLDGIGAVDITRRCKEKDLIDITLRTSS
jgi:hypothetical protein